MLKTAARLVLGTPFNVAIGAPRPMSPVSTYSCSSGRTASQRKRPAVWRSGEGDDKQG